MRTKNKKAINIEWDKKCITLTSGTKSIDFSTIASITEEIEKYKLERENALKAKITELIGEASLCWITPTDGSDRIFDSTKALNIVNKIMTEIAEYKK